MHTANDVWIDADPDAVFRLAEDVERWPELLPHYRYVRVLSRSGDSRTLEMSASRDGVPVRWTSVLRPLPDEHRLLFEHVGGITRGMRVEWRLHPQHGGTYVVIEHDLDLKWPSGIRQVGELVIGTIFVSNIAGKTLRRIKQIAEGEEK